MNLKEHLLTSLAEEAVEVAQRATKALRFGLLETQVGQSHNNTVRLRHELADLLAVIEMLEKESGVKILTDQAEELERLKRAKKQRVKDYLLLSASRGTLQESSEEDA